jgi:hypothetical protein
MHSLIDASGFEIALTGKPIFRSGRTRSATGIDQTVH